MSRDVGRRRNREPSRGAEEGAARFIDSIAVVGGGNGQEERGILHTGKLCLIFAYLEVTLEFKFFPGSCVHNIKDLYQQMKRLTTSGPA